ncbi:MAG: site-specific integrase [Devosia sp.]
MPDYQLKLYRGRWCAYWREDGRPRRKALRTTDKAEAQQQLEVLRWQERLPADTTIEALWAAYCEDYDGRPIAKAMRWEWAVMADSFGHLYPSQITLKVVEGHIKKRRTKGVNDGTLWTELGHLRGVLSWAVKRELIDRAPFIPRPSKPAPRERHLSREEVRALIDSCVMPHVRLYVILLVGTGARSAAILDLTWDRVDFFRGQIKLATPGHERRKGRATVPMNDELRAALSEAFAGRTCDHVIEHGGQRVKSIKTGYNAAVRRAKLEDVTAHSLRHTAAVWMAEGGVSMAQIAQFLGHTDSRLTERVYARFQPDHLADAASHLQIGLVRVQMNRGSTS